jgi:hypothetical protein
MPKNQKIKAEDLFPKICSINRRPKETRSAQTVFDSRKPIYSTYFLTGKSPRPIGKKRKNNKEWLLVGGRTKRRAGAGLVRGSFFLSRLFCLLFVAMTKSKKKTSKKL